MQERLGSLPSAQRLVGSKRKHREVFSLRATSGPAMDSKHDGCSQSHASSLRSDRRGAVAVEYVVLLGVCAIGAAAAIVGLGPALVANYETSQGILLSPFP
jgi:Flp pilus assembly pilin Flp